LRNLAVLLPLVPNGLEFGRCYCRYTLQLNVSSGTVEVLTALPDFTVTPNGLTLNCAFTGPDGIEVSWDFGDNTQLARGSSAQHTYARPGRYEVSTRLVRDRKLVEYRSAIVVSANHSTVAPLIVTPVFSASAASTDGTVALTVSAPTTVTDVSIDCSAGRVRARADSGAATLNLAPGVCTLEFLATRKLSARFYSKQLYQPTNPVTLYRDRISTNRTFALTTGTETTALPNELTTHLFGDGSVTASPVDRWTLELPLEENPWFTTVSPSDLPEFDGAEFADAILSLEFRCAQ